MMYVWRGIVAGIAIGVAAGASAQAPPPKSDEDPPLPKFVEMVVPSAVELLRARPVDWVVLLTGDVLVVEPVPLRPNTLKTMQQKYDEWRKEKPLGMSIDDYRARMHELGRLQLTLVDGGEEPDYLLDLRYIDRIVYFEDLILKRAAALMDEGRLPSAYELLTFVDRRHRGWPEFDTHYRRFVFLEAERLGRLGHDEAALVQFERLYGLDPKYPQLSESWGATIHRLIESSVVKDDFRRARHFLARLERREPEHGVVKKWREELAAQARQVMTAARSATTEGRPRDAVALADRAARIWPESGGLRDVHREFTARYQVVHAGVVRLPGTPTAYPFDGIDDERRRRLCEIPLFEPDRLSEDGVVRYRSAFIESWEPRDLGRELQFQLRPRRGSWESRPVLTAGMIVDGIAARAAAGAQSGDDRWAANLRAIAAESPWEWRLSLNQIPLRVEGWLRVPIPLPPEAAAWNTDVNPAAWSNPHEQRFRFAEQTDDVVTFLRTRPEADNVASRHVAEIREHRFADWDRLLQGLNRGEIDFTPVAEWRDLPALQQDNRFFVQPYALPRTHVVLVNPHSRVALNGPLRRALLHALPREDLLRQHVLEHGPDAFGRTVNSPFATNTYAYDSRLSSPEHSASMAASLAATAKKDLGGELPVLKLRAPPDAVVARVLPHMIEHWKRAGITVSVLPDDSPRDEPWDLLYVTVRLTEPYVDLWTLLAAAGPVDWQTLQIFPHWLREQLLQLERTVDWSHATRLLRRIQAEFLVEARWLPLWEVDEYLVARKRITGLPERPMHAYDGVERWTVGSWYPMETP